MRSHGLVSDCRLWTLWMLLVVSCQDASASSELEGVWITKSIDIGDPEFENALKAAGGKSLEIEGDSLAFYGDKKMSFKFTIDAAKDPRRISLYEDGKVVLRGIYKFKEGDLILCLSEHEYPTAFTAARGKTGSSLFTFHRAKK